MLFFVLQKIMLRFEQVAGLQDHRFGFVEDRQVEDAGACAHRLVAVDAAQLALGMYYNQGKDEESRETYLKDILEQRNMNASIDTKAKVDKDSKILTLSTCHAAGKNYRYLVQAYLVKEEHE